MFKKLFVLSSVVIILFSSFVSFGKTSYASGNLPEKTKSFCREEIPCYTFEGSR